MQVFVSTPPEDVDVEAFQHLVGKRQLATLELHPKLAKTKPWARLLASLNGVDVRETRGVAMWAVHYAVEQAPPPPEHAQNRGKQAADVASGAKGVSEVGAVGERVGVGLKYILEQ